MSALSPHVPNSSILLQLHRIDTQVPLHPSLDNHIECPVRYSQVAPFGIISRFHLHGQLRPFTLIRGPLEVHSDGRSSNCDSSSLTGHHHLSGAQEYVGEFRSQRIHFITSPSPLKPADDELGELFVSIGGRCHWPPVDQFAISEGSPSYAA